MTSVYPGSGPGDPRPAPDPRPASLVERILYLQWGPIVAGAIAAAASLVPALRIAGLNPADTLRDE